MNDELLMRLNMRLICLVLTAILLIVGYVNKLPFIAGCWSILYILVAIANLLIIIRYERLGQKGKYHVKRFNSGIALMNQLCVFFELAIFFFAAITFIFFPSWFPKGLWISSAIIAIGQLFLWVLSGVIARRIKHVPIRMGFSSWHIQRKVE